MYSPNFGTSWIRKVKGIPNINKHEFQMTVRGKSYVIPTFTKPTEDISMDQPSSKISSCCTSVIRNTAQNSTRDTETSEPSEEWHAPEGFKLPDSVTEEKSLYNALKAIIELNDCNEGFQRKYKLVPISVKYKDEIITVTGNVVVIDDGKTNYLLCIGTSWIRKVKGIPNINKHEFQMTVRGKSYVIPTFTKPTEDISMDQPSSKISSCCTSVIRNTAQNSTRDTETSEPSEEWHAPEGFKLPDSVTEEGFQRKYKLGISSFLEPTLIFSVGFSLLTNIELLLDIGSDMRTDLELLFFIFVFGEVEDSRCRFEESPKGLLCNNDLLCNKISPPIRLEFSGKVVNIGTLPLSILIVSIYSEVRDVEPRR
ncbi:hypothetical protein Glove_460g25 [Diversispora epigaea]|uniref:Uncharacterized protein n=1 Tax=Diversispora epigaea TaxID=1348612 RepID=A0A397GQE9_9GLOM|nr:hypothetical protein Glove_460g25 [Diversispora epigaea]